MKIIAWNVNGIKSLIKQNHLFKLIENEKPTIICFSETKLSCPFFDIQEQLKIKINGYPYRYYRTCGENGGYSGTAIFSQKQPINIYYGINLPESVDEGRVITLEFNKFYLIHTYTPNSGQTLQRLDFRINKWDISFKKYLYELNKIKPIIVCGDLNVANEEIDIHNPKGNKKIAGFTNEERNSFKKILIDLNLIDTYRYLNPNKIEYSYWTYRFNSRKKNKGWRLDYFLVSKKLLNMLKNLKF